MGTEEDKITALSCTGGWAGSSLQLHREYVIGKGVNAGRGPTAQGHCRALASVVSIFGGALVVNLRLTEAVARGASLQLSKAGTVSFWYSACADAC